MMVADAPYDEQGPQHILHLPSGLHLLPVLSGGMRLTTNEKKRPQANTRLGSTQLKRLLRRGDEAVGG